jgi:nitronate monooxygenase
MKYPAILKDLRLPVIAAPMYIASGLDLVVAECKAGIVGTFPALNARGAGEFERWIEHIESATYAPFGVNLILHKTNNRLQEDLATCVRRKVPIVITSVGDPAAVVEVVHGYGGLVFHDVINERHARKAARAGVDGLILVCAGAGGHAGRLSPFAFVGEVRHWFDGLIVLGGAITKGQHIIAARALGADLVYMGTRFLAANEAAIPEDYRHAVLEAHAADIVYTDLFSGVHASFLRSSVAAAGFDPDHLPAKGADHQENFGSKSMAASKVWRDIWSAGQGVGQIEAVMSTEQIVSMLCDETLHARHCLQSTGV